MADLGDYLEIWELQPHAMLLACHRPVRGSFYFVTVIKCQIQGWVYVVTVSLVVSVLKV